MAKKTDKTDQNLQEYAKLSDLDVNSLIYLQSRLLNLVEALDTAETRIRELEGRVSDYMGRLAAAEKRNQWLQSEITKITADLEEALRR
jgi:predicted  nucleic acid-binding Zn-ribbon protein